MGKEEEVLSEAEVLANREHWKEAAELLSDYRKSSPLSVQALGKLAYYSSRGGNYDGAIFLYQDLCRRQPSEARWFYSLAFQFEKKEEWREAVALYEESFRLAPRWLRAALKLGDSYGAVRQVERALEVYSKGIQIYREFSVDRRNAFATVYAELCARAARALLSNPGASENDLREGIRLFQDSVAADPKNANNWYRLGCALLDGRRVDEALDCLQKAEGLAPKKEYVFHKIAQAYLRKRDPDEALKAYERVPLHRRAPYILHGIAQCYMAKGEAMEAARRLYQAIQREPGKFYHHWDYGLALATLGASDQAIEALERANELFRQEYGKEYRKALVKLQEVRTTLPPGEHVSFEEASPITVVSFGAVTRYDSRRGFGFIKDDTDGANVFFHITCVKGRVVPQVDARMRYIRGVGEKGPQAVKVWLVGAGGKRGQE